MDKKIISTKSAPLAIGPYSQAVSVGNTVYCSGQIPLDPKTMKIVSEDFTQQAEQIFKNLSAVAEASGCNLQNFVKLTIYLTDLSDFPKINDVMKKYMVEPYPARAAIGVKQLPLNSLVEIEGILVI